MALRIGLLGCGRIGQMHAELLSSRVSRAELTLVCDFVIATDRSWWGMPEINWAITPGWGGTGRLAKFAGRRKAKEWNLDPKRVGSTGGSAGACTSLWLAFHDGGYFPGTAALVATELALLLALRVALARVPWEGLSTPLALTVLFMAALAGHIAEALAIAALPPSEDVEAQ